MTLDRLIAELSRLREIYPEFGGERVEVEHDDGALAPLRVAEVDRPGTGCVVLIVADAS